MISRISLKNKHDLKFFRSYLFSFYEILMALKLLLWRTFKGQFLGSSTLSSTNFTICFDCRESDIFLWKLLHLEVKYLNFLMILCKKEENLPSTTTERTFGSFSCAPWERGTSYRCQNQMGMKLEKMEMHTCKRSRKKPRQINVWFTLLLACHRKKSKVKVGDDWVEIMDSAQRCDLIVLCPVDAYS